MYDNTIHEYSVASKSKATARWNRSKDAVARVGTGTSSSERTRRVQSMVSHLSCRDELQRPQGDLQIGSVGLEIVQSTGDALLQLGGVLPRRAVGCDLVRRGRHDY